MNALKSSEKARAKGGLATAEAKALAEAIAKQYGVTVTVLAPVGEVEGTVEPRWEKAIPGADVVPFGWAGGSSP